LKIKKVLPSVDVLKATCEAKGETEKMIATKLDSLTNLHKLVDTTLEQN
jgi:hypothetical protein